MNTTLPAAGAAISNERPTFRTSTDAPLGTHAQNVSASGSKWTLQRWAAELLPGERVGYCLRRLVAGKNGAVGCYYHRPTGKASFGGLMTCGSVWVCPCCASKIGERRRVELDAAVATWRAQGGRVLLVTVTHRHARRDDLLVNVHGFLSAWRALRGGRWAKRFDAEHGIRGFVRALEPTHSYVNGWHVHAHLLVFVEREVDVDTMQLQLLQRWRSMLLKQGLRDVNDHAIRVEEAKDDEASEAVAAYVGKVAGWSVGAELAKANVKRGRRTGRTPMQLVVDYGTCDDQRAGRLFQEYAAVFRGRRQLVWSNGLRDLLGLGKEQSDRELAEERRETQELIAEVPSAVWECVLANDARGELLERVSTGDAGVVWEFLFLLGCPVPFEAVRSRWVPQDG